VKKTTTEPHKWAFRACFRARAYDWQGTKLARQRLREAVSEIKKVRRQDPLLAGEGAVLLVERLWPALKHIDSSSGAIGTAVNKTVAALLPVLVEAPAESATRERWLDRLWQAYEEDGVDYTYAIADHWGELCGSPEVASKWADKLLPPLRHSWRPDDTGGYFGGTPACLSCLLRAGRYQELLDLIDTARFVWWPDRKFGVRALVAMGKTEEALRYAASSKGLNDPEQPIAEACEEILISSGRAEEAYEKHSLIANQSGARLATFRAIARKYPHKDKDEILADLVASTPGNEGLWFATARQLGRLELAIELARLSPVEPRTLNRAARDHLETDPEFVRYAGLLSLYWITQGAGYEITGSDVRQAFDYALAAAKRLDNVAETEAAIREIASHGDPFVRQMLRGWIRL
jgi:hypothetical protein